MKSPLLSLPGAKEARAKAFVLGASVFVVFIAAVVIPYASGYSLERKALAYWLRLHWPTETWSHCLLVLPILFWQIWRDRKSILGAFGNGSWLGWSVLVLGSLCFVAGYRANNHYVGYVAVQLVVGGMILATGGLVLFRALWFHWVFLGFLWPFFFLENTVAYPLRVLLTDISVKFLNVAGLSTIQSGTTLLSAPDAAAALATGDRFRLDIEGPCSGLRSLFAMMMVGAVFARMTQKKLWAGMVVFLSSLPMAVLGNFVRLLLLVAGTLMWGSEFAIGPVNEKGETETSAYHFFAGIAVFLVGLVGLSVVAALCAKGFRRKGDTIKRTVQSRETAPKPTIEP